MLASPTHAQVEGSGNCLVVPMALVLGFTVRGQHTREVVGGEAGRQAGQEGGGRGGRQAGRPGEWLEFVMLSGGPGRWWEFVMLGGGPDLGQSWGRGKGKVIISNRAQGH